MQQPSSYGRLANADIVESIADFLGPRDALNLIQTSKPVYRELSQTVRHKQSGQVMGMALVRINELLNFKTLVARARTHPSEVATALADAFTVASSMQGDDGRCFVPVEGGKSLAAVLSATRDPAELRHIHRYMSATDEFRNSAVTLLCMYNVLYESYDLSRHIRDTFVFENPAMDIADLLQLFPEVEFTIRQPEYLDDAGAWAHVNGGPVRDAITDAVFDCAPQVFRRPLGTARDWEYLYVPHVTQLVRPAEDRRVHLRLDPLTAEGLRECVQETTMSFTVYMARAALERVSVMIDERLLH